MKKEFIIIFFRLYAVTSSSEMSKKKDGWMVQKVPLFSECCSAHTTGTVHSPLCMP
jgi:hypothetical protein